MTISSDQRQALQTIMNRAKNPHHQGQTDPIDLQKRGHNPFCGDMVALTLALDEAENRIKDIKFEGKGCVLCLASADLMADTVKGKELEEVLFTVQHFRRMMRGEGTFSQELRKLNVLQGVARYPARVKCALLAWHTLKGALELKVQKGTESFCDTDGRKH